MTKRFGFTLAEVLITLAIIGVVAAMTIPTLMTSTNQQEFKTAIKKAVSVLNQAVTMNVALENSNFSNIVGISSDPINKDGLQDLFANRMNVVSTETIGTLVGAGDGKVANTSGTANEAFFTADGMMFDLGAASTSGNCTDTAPCIIIVDINGDKKPNRLTTDSASLSDRFMLQLRAQQVIPHGAAAQEAMYK